MPTEKGDCSGFSLAGQWAKPVLHGRISGQTFASHKLLRRASVSVWFCGSGSSRPGQLPRVQCRLALRQAELRTDCVGAVVPEPVVTEVLSCTYLIISISHCSYSAAFSCCAVWPCRPTHQRLLSLSHSLLFLSLPMPFSRLSSFFLSGPSVMTEQLQSACSGKNT